MGVSENILKTVAKLPPFPIVLQRAIQLLSDPNSSVQAIVDAIELDQSITANVLRLCNSAYFGRRRRVPSLKEALVLIGFNRLIEIIFDHESIGLFFAHDAQYTELWRHSVGCALLSGIVSKRLNRRTTPAYFTAALLHDIGKVALAVSFRDYLGEIKKCIQKEHLSFTEAEKKLIGVDHAMLGGILMETWSCPKPIVEAIRYHHTPSLASTNQEIVQRVYLCDLISAMMGIGDVVDEMSYQAYEEIWKQYNLKEEDKDWFIVQLKDRFHFVKEVLNLTVQQQEDSNLSDFIDTQILP